MSEIRWDKNKCRCYHTLKQRHYQVIGGCCMKTIMSFINKGNKLKVSLIVKIRRRKRRNKIKRFGLISIMLILLWKYYSLERRQMTNLGVISKGKEKVWHWNRNLSLDWLYKHFQNIIFFLHKITHYHINF